jgi:hypothetical protein
MCARPGVRVRRTPHLLQQRVVGHQPSAILYQHPEELELDRRRADLVTVAAHFA